MGQYIILPDEIDLVERNRVQPVVVELDDPVVETVVEGSYSLLVRVLTILQLPGVRLFMPDLLLLLGDEGRIHDFCHNVVAELFLSF